MRRWSGIPIGFALALACPPVLGQAKSTPPTPEVRQKMREQTDQLRMLVAQLPESPYRADVSVYVKAGEFMNSLEEFGDPKIGDKTLTVLASGLKRAEELQKLKPGTAPSWTKVRGKPVIRGYTSRIDGSVQPYAVNIPQGAEVPERLDVVLHGRDGTLTETKFIWSRENGKVTTSPFQGIHLEVYGRGNNAYRWAGETDIHEAVENFATRAQREGLTSFDLRTKAVVMRGFSMGGAGAWHMGLHFPFRYDVVSPGAGFTTTHGYARSVPAQLPDHVERTLRIYDAVNYAENAANIPIVAYSGSKDPQKAAADNIFNRLEKFPEPVQAVHLVAEGLEHKMPPEWQAQAEAAYQKHLGRNRTSPDRVRFVTYTTRYSDAGVATILGLDRHYDQAVFEARRTGKDWQIKTRNIRAFALDPTKAGVTKLNIDNQMLTPQQFAVGPTEEVFVKENGQWKSFGPRTAWDKQLAKQPQKAPGLQGPIDDAFMEPFLVVSGAKHAPTDTLRDQFEKNWIRYFRGQLPHKSAQDVTEKDHDRHLVLFGTPESNPLLARILPQLPIQWSANELVVNGQKYDARTHLPVLIYPNPLNPTRYVVINSGHTFGEADLKGTNAMLFPRLGDWAVVTPAPTKADPAALEVHAAGLFDEFWKFPSTK